MRSGRRPPAPDARAAALPAPRPRPPTRCRASGRRWRTRPAAAAQAAPPAHSRREPLPPARMPLAPPELALGLGNGRRDLIGIQRVRDHRHSAQLAEHRVHCLAARHAMNLMTCGNQTLHPLLADPPRRTSHKHPHHWLLDRRIFYTHYDGMAAPAVTPASHRHEKRLLVSTLLISSEGAHQLVEGDQPL